jgi:hypothetical protein
MTGEFDRVLGGRQLAGVCVPIIPSRLRTWHLRTLLIASQPMAAVLLSLISTLVFSFRSRLVLQAEIRFSAAWADLDWRRLPRNRMKSKVRRLRVNPACERVSHSMGTALHSGALNSSAYRTRIILPGI